MYNSSIFRRSLHLKIEEMHTKIPAVYKTNMFTNQFSGKSTCSHNITECMTIGARNVYSSLVAGIKDVTEPIDPMHIDKIDADFPRLKYHITNATLNGLKNCAVESFK